MEESAIDLLLMSRLRDENHPNLTVFSNSTF